jgi:cysteine desulfurase/selenocysteine lyase
MSAALPTVRGFNVAALRADFPALHQHINGHPLVYLDSAATTQKPQSVISAISEYYEKDNANVHRGVHSLSDRATQRFEAARVTVARFLNSPDPMQVVWTRGTTEAINLVAQTWGLQNLKAGDRILVPILEHHSNIVPWQMLAQRVGAEVIACPLDSHGDIDLDALDSLLDERVRLLAIAQASNALGTVHALHDIIRRARRAGALVLVDGAQGVAHCDVDVQALDCDFYAFSGHKLFGPTGIGVLWAKRALLEAMPPWQGGGEMIEQVSFDGTTFNAPPFRFEAGTPNIAGAIGLAAAIDYLQSWDREQLQRHETELLNYCLEQASRVPGLRRVGSPRSAVSIFSFLIDGSHPSDIGMLLDEQGIAVRTGHHCAQPLMSAWALPGTVRASFSIYNTHADVDRLIAALQSAVRLLG